MHVKKRKSTRETKNMVQTALWLPRGLHEELKKAGGERGLGEEIRRRLLEISPDVATTPVDEITTEVLQQISDIARDLSGDEPLWADRFAFDVFKAAINALLSSHQPSSEPKPETRARLQAVYGHEDPGTIGLIIARAAILAYSRERWGQAILDKLPGVVRQASRAVRGRPAEGNERKDDPGTDRQK